MAKVIVKNNQGELISLDLSLLENPKPQDKDNIQMLYDRGLIKYSSYRQLLNVIKKQGFTPGVVK